MLRPDVYVLAAAILPSGFAIPNTDAAIIGYRLAITPDRLVGRVDSVQTTIAIAGTFSPSIRTAPSLDDLDALRAPR